MKRTVLVLGTVSVVCLLGILVFVVTRAPEPQGDSQQTRIPSPVPVEDTGLSLSIAEHSLDEITTTIGFVVFEAAEGASLGSDDREGLQAAVEGAFGAYLSDSIEKMIDYMESNGIEPPERYFSDPESSSKLWDTWYGTVADARLQVGDLIVRPAAPPTQAKTGFGNRLATRPGSRPSIEDLPENMRQSVEVVLPGSFRSVTGTVFDAKLGMSFSRDESGHWVLMSIAYYDVPNGTAIPTLPI